jgi:hypothetical protein
MLINGYKWNTAEEADLSMIKLNEFYGLPVPDGISYFSSDSYYYSENNIYYMYYNEMLEPVLGEPSEFIVTPPPFEI